MSLNYENNVYINCPFDNEYRPIFHAIVFAIHDSGFIPNCALQIRDASQITLEKIMGIISQCKYGIHDISRTELDTVNSLPRFNMPLELGIFLGCKKFGNKIHRSKTCLIIDKEQYRFQKFISDISGQVVYPHNNNPEEVIKVVRDWLRTESKRNNIPGGTKIYERYTLFETKLPDICRELNIQVKELTFVDFVHVMTEFLKANPL